MMKRLLELIRRGWRKPPHVILRWLARQIAAELEQPLARARARAMTKARLLSLLGADNLDNLWTRLSEAPFPFHTEPVTKDTYESAYPGDAARIMAAAEDAVAHRVDLLGSGPVDLGSPVPWHTDFKSGHSWPVLPFRRINVLDLERDSDIKVPWELSRLQWLIPAGQAYLLTGEDRFAEAVLYVVEDWAAANPMARGVNWACTMDVALRGITLVWLFHVFHNAPAWRDSRFRANFLNLLYLHGDFTSRNLEWSDINGNHLGTDAAGLVMMGLFFGDGDAPQSWQQQGWDILSDELPKQVFRDGVDFEVSSAYQRLVMEIFLLPALYRQKAGLEVGREYSDRLGKMATFIATYTRTDGSTPLWGDADDGRVLPFGGQAMTEHRYMIALAGIGFGDADVFSLASGPTVEVFWCLGPDAIAKIPDHPTLPDSHAFRHGGVYIMRNDDDHVFIDGGPVGMAGRGGHGHNDCLSFEASLLGATLLTDCGAYVYSADPAWRNDFRSTGFHNTPIIGGEEQNRFVRPEYLWSLHNDAEPDVRHWSNEGNWDRFVGAHTGYHRLPAPVTPVRGIALDKINHRLVIADHFEGGGDHGVRVPYHFPPGIDAAEETPGLWRLTADGEEFLLVCNGGEDWTATLGDGWVSPSYGVKHPAKVLNFFRHGPLLPLAVAILPAEDAPDDPLAWLAETVEGFEITG
ncbi:MAG: alginate lyase family protein [Alphaproteobacteria bacterium]|nr:alginate lyase family protein [Alphaproteobacteria bacterium]